MPIIAGRASAAYGAGFSRVVTAPYLGPFGAYDSLATVLSPASQTFTFSVIPTGYKHLQIRGIANNGETSGWNNQNIRFNADTSANYSYHVLYGNGTSALTANSTSNTSINDAFRIPPTGTFGGFIIDILDYGSVTKAKTIRVFNGGDTNSVAWTAIHSGLWFKTPEAITSITLGSSVGNFGTNSRFSLYGIK